MSTAAARSAAVTVPRRDTAERRERTREAILDAAEALLREGEGMTELSIGRIVGRAGISRPTFYTYYADKRELVAGLIDRHTAPLREIGAAMTRIENPTREAIHGVVDGAIAIWREQAAVLGAVIEMAAYDEWAAGQWGWFLSAIAAAAAELVRRGRNQAGDSTEIPSATDIGFVITHMAERCFSQMLGRESSDQRAAEVGDAIAEVLWRAIAPCAAASG